MKTYQWLWIALAGLVVAMQAPVARAQADDDPQDGNEVDTAPDAVDQFKAEPAQDSDPAATDREAKLVAEREKRIKANAQRAHDLDTFNDAVAQLVREASQIEELDSKKVTDPFQARRPHPKLATLSAEMAPLVINRMTRSFTGNDYRDTYIRWHLMYVVKKVSDEDRRDFGQALLRLMTSIPGELRIARVREWNWEPEDMHKAHMRERGEASMGVAMSVREGYPPFVRQIDPPASFARMSESQRAKAEAVWTRWKEIDARYKDTYKQVFIPGARERNNRIDQVNHIVREFRGELLYQLLLTGDPSMLTRVCQEVDKRARGKERSAFDLMAYMYVAAFDDVFERYTPEALAEAATRLEKTAYATDAWTTYSDTYGRPIRRNFADYSFHMYNMLRDGGFIPPRELDSGETRKGRGRFAN